MTAPDLESPLEMVQRLAQATTAHDLERLVDCFAVDYVNVTPVHPARGFTGRDQVRVNWRQIFAAVPDLKAELLDSATVGNTVWSEWQMSGTRRDGASHLMRGVIVFGVSQGRADWARFYLELVQHDDKESIDSAVAAQLGVGR
jgi:ketosteroid isomerase-like protein